MIPSYKKRGLYFIDQQAFPLTSAVEHWDYEPNIKYNRSTRQVTDTGSDAACITRNNFNSNGNMVADVGRFLSFRKQTLVEDYPQRILFSEAIHVNHLNKLTRTTTVDNSFARKVYSLAGNINQIIDVSNMTADGKGWTSKKRPGRSAARGHPKLPIVSNSYDAYERAVLLLPGGVEAFRDVLRDMKRVQWDGTPQLVTAGDKFAPKKQTIISVRDLPEEDTDHAIGLTIKRYLKWDARKEKIEHIQDMIDRGALDASVGEEEIDRILASKPIHGTILQPLHEFNEENYWQVLDAEPQLRLSFEYMKVLWKEFAGPKTYFAANYEEGFDEFVRYCCSKLGVQPQRDQYIIPEYAKVSDEYSEETEQPSTFEAEQEVSDSEE